MMVVHFLVQVDVMEACYTDARVNHADCATIDPGTRATAYDGSTKASINTDREYRND
jgi:hypothetical protein